MAEVLSGKNLCLTCSHLFASIYSNKSSSVVGFSSPAFKFQSLKCFLNSEFHGRQQIVVPQQGIKSNSKNLQNFSVQMSLSIGKSLKWWEKSLQPNMKEINSAQDLVDSLLNAGDKLVIVDFFSPGCGGCRALHPKICQFAEMNPDIQFLQINYEEHKSMCYSLNVHVLPFFRFYKGAQGRLCSFSCTNATIKKFKGALAKHTTGDCSHGTAKGLEEKELSALASNKELSFYYQPKPIPVPAGIAMDPQDKAPATTQKTKPSSLKTTQNSEEKSLIAAGR